MKSIKLTIVGYLFEGVIYQTKQAWLIAKAKAEKVKNHKFFAKLLKSIIVTDKVQEAKDKLKKLGYSFSRYVELIKAKAKAKEFFIYLPKKERVLLCD